MHGSGGTVSASIRRRWRRVRERPTRAAPHRRSDGAPAPVLRRAGPRAPPGCGPRASLSRRHAHHPQPAQVQGGAGDVPFVAHFVRPRNMKPRKPIACLRSACRRTTCGTRARPNSAAGRRGRRRSAYGGAARGGRSRHPTRRRRIEAETAPPPPRTTVSGHAPTGRSAGPSARCGRRGSRSSSGSRRRRRPHCRSRPSPGASSAPGSGTARGCRPSAGGRCRHGAP